MRLTQKESKTLRAWVHENDYQLCVDGARYASAAIRATGAIGSAVTVSQFKVCQKRAFKESDMRQRYYGFGASLRRKPESLTNCMWDRLQKALVKHVAPGKRLLGITRELQGEKIASVPFSSDAIKQAVHNHRVRYGVDWDDLSAVDPMLVEFKDAQTPETAKRKD